MDEILIDIDAVKSNDHFPGNIEVINCYRTKQHNNVFGKIVNYFKHKDEDSNEDLDEDLDENEDYEKDDNIKKEEGYQIAISQDGKFAATFDTANLLISILQNTDYRPFVFGKKNSSNRKGSNELIYKIINFYINVNNKETKDYDYPWFLVGNEGKTGDTFRWSIDISNEYEKNGKYFVLAAISRTNINEDMKITKKKKNESVVNKDIENGNKNNKGIAIYRIELNKNQRGVNESTNVTCYYFNNVSGIFKFIESTNEEKEESSNKEKEESSNKEKEVSSNKEKEESSNNEKEVSSNKEKKESSNEEKKESSNKEKENKLKGNKLERLIILNIHGMQNLEFGDDYDSFKLGEKFEYPSCFKRKLNNWYSGRDNGCMNRLLSCVYNKYLLVTLYKKDIESLEVYNLEKMELETISKRFKKEDELYNFVKKNDYNVFNKFTVSRLHLCFTQGNNIIKLYCMENGLQIASKKFEEIEKIHLLEFIDNEEKLLIIGNDKCSDKDGKKQFIIWDLYDTGKYELVMLDDFLITNEENFDAHLARTSGNILRIDENGKVTSVIKKVKEGIEYKKTSNGKCSVIELNSKEDKDKNHKLFYENNTNFEPIVNEKEPWVKVNYERNSYCLYCTETETIQLIVGRSTVQIWRQIRKIGEPQENEDDSKKKKVELPNEGEPFLEYIWTNRIPVHQESEKTKLQIEKFQMFKCESNEPNICKINDFYLKVFWYENEKMEIHEKMKTMEKRGSSKPTKKREKVIKRKDIIEKFRAVRRACKALEHLNKRYVNKDLVDNYVRVRNYEEMITYIKHIVWKFIANEPQNFKLLDVRHNVMKSLILGDCDDLIKFILFGDKDPPRIKNKELGHIPSNKLWPGKRLLRDDDLDFDEIKDQRLKNKEFKIRSSMELAIYHCKDKDTNIVAYLLEYYSEHAINCAGWLHTVSTAIPLLLEYNYDDYVEKLFFKECFTGLTQDSIEAPIKLLSNNKFEAFEVDKLKSYKHESYNKKKIEEFEVIESPLLRIVPLPGFNQNNIKKKKEHDAFKRILDSILYLFIPRWYEIKQNEKIKLSPFSRMVLCKNDNIYNNPAIEAVINFDWHEARNHFIATFLRFLIFAICFGLISWTYLNNNTNINQNFLFILIVLFYYLAIYLLITELLKFIYRGFKKYFSEIYYIFDVISIVFPVIIMSIMLKNSDSIGSVKEIDSELILGISFSIFLIWIELIFYLRLAPYIGIYIYHFLIICKKILPFFLVMLIVILAFAHTMFLLLRNPVNISTNDSTYSGVATNSLTNESLNIKLKSDFDPTSNDNPYTSLYKAIMTTYFWTSGNWIQREDFDFWAVDIYTFIASIFLVVVLQNMLIAFMSDEYTDVKDKSRQILLKHKANRIADYEALHHFHIFSNDEAKPNIIYYIGRPENYEEWNNIRKDNDKSTIYKDLAVEHISTKFIFGKRNYDGRSIWEYQHDK